MANGGEWTCIGGATLSDRRAGGWSAELVPPAPDTDPGPPPSAVGRTESEAAIRDEFDAFVSQVRGRVEQGARDYGDRSFDLPPARLLKEIHEEVLDVCGWAFIAHVKIKRMEARLSRLGTE